MRSLFISLIVMLAAALVCQGFWQGADAGGDKKDKQPAKLTDAEIEKLVKDLGSDNPRMRDTASKALLEIGSDALPFLVKGTKSSDAEIRRRAELLYERIVERDTQSKLILVRKYGLDTIVERMTWKADRATDEDWRVVARLIDDISDEAITKGVDIPNRANYLKKKLAIINGKVKWIVNSRVLGVDIETELGVMESFGMCKGDLRLGTGFHSSVILSNGSVRSKGSILGSVVISDGDIATPNVIDSVVISTGKVNISNLKKKSVVIEDYRDNFRSVRFFSLEDLGLDVSLKGGSVHVTRVGENSFFGKAGFLPLDTITKIDGKKIESVEGAHRLLRHSVAVGQLEVQVLRAHVVHNITAPVAW